MQILIAPMRWLAMLVALWMPSVAAAQTADKPFGKEQLDQLTAQVALYPDALLSQVLMAATYPADVAEAAKWSRANSEQKGDDAVRMVQDQPWDPSVQSLVAFPQVIIMMGEKPDWVRDLGDAFLAQPDDVMDSVQRLRQAAQKAGNLQSNQQIVVNVQSAPPPEVVIDVSAPPPPPQVIVIEQRSPEVIFVPTYNPMYVFGPWLWPAYPPIFVPPPPGFWFSTAVATGIAWGVGIGVRNAIWGSPNWWNRSVNINVNRYNNININNRIDRTNINNQRWSHNVENRRNVAYRGGDATRQNLERKAQATNREQFRGKDADRQLAQDRSRDAERQRAQQSLQQRGVSTDRAALSDANRGQLQQQARDLDRGQARDRAQSMDRSAMQDRAQSMDRSAMQDRGGNRNEAFQGVNDRRAGSEINRGAASRQSMQQSGGARAQPQMQRSGGGGGAPAVGGGGAGGGARAGGGGGRGGGGRGR